MAIGRMKPKVFSAEQFEKIQGAAERQTGRSVIVRSTDPDNFPVFEIPVNKKLLVYVPNHRVVNAEGVEQIRWDKGAIHSVRDGGSYAEYRCLAGIVHTDLGYDGTCPLCDTQNEIWDLYRKDYAEICKVRGVDPNENSDALKEERIELVRNQVVKVGEVWVTFPIVVIECEEGTTTPKLDNDGRLEGTPMWYRIREMTYQDKWVKGFDAFPDDTSHPAGKWFVLNYTYTPKSGKHDKMGSARALAVTYRPMDESYRDYEHYYDELTAEWTPQKSSEVVIPNHFLDINDLKEVADKVMTPVRNKLAMYELANPSQTAVTVSSGTADDTLKNFGATPVETGTQGAPPVPPQAPVGDVGSAGIG